MRRDRQFIFLSPLDITGITNTQFRTVHKLKDPVRNNMTIEEGFEASAAAARQEQEERKEGDADE
jgi:hypothetical protein